MTILVNILAFQAGWLVCVWGGASHRPWLGTGTAVIVIAWHLWRAAHPRREFVLIVIAGGLGFAWDSALVSAGLLSYPSGILLDGTAPHWIVALWMMFATTLNVSLRWLKDRPLPGALLGAVAGPVAYWAGSRLGGVEFLEPLPATVALAVGWAGALPLLMTCAKRFDGTALRVAHA